MTTPAVQGVVDRIRRGLRAPSNWQCRVEGCEAAAIESHLLQRNGVLSEIESNDEIVEFYSESLFHRPGRFRVKAARRAFAFPGFCADHDQRIFAPVESAPLNLNTPATSMLLAYRAAEHEVWKNENWARVYSLAQEAPPPRGHEDEWAKARQLWPEHVAKKADRARLLARIARHVGSARESASGYHVAVVEIDRIEVCVSSVWGPAGIDHLGNVIASGMALNVFPRGSRSFILLAGHVPRDVFDEIAKDAAAHPAYFLDEILSTWVETWCLSKRLRTELFPLAIDETRWVDGVASRLYDKTQPALAVFRKRRLTRGQIVFQKAAQP